MFAALHAIPIHQESAAACPSASQRFHARAHNRECSAVPDGQSRHSLCRQLAYPTPLHWNHRSLVSSALPSFVRPPHETAQLCRPMRSNADSKFLYGDPAGFAVAIPGEVGSRLLPGLRRRRANSSSVKTSRTRLRLTGIWTLMRSQARLTFGGLSPAFSYSLRRTVRISGFEAVEESSGIVALLHLGPFDQIYELIRDLGQICQRETGKAESPDSLSVGKQLVDRHVDDPNRAINTKLV